MIGAEFRLGLLVSAVIHSTIVAGLASAPAQFAVTSAPYGGEISFVSAGTGRPRVSATAGKPTTLSPSSPTASAQPVSSPTTAALQTQTQSQTQSRPMSSGTQGALSDLRPLNRYNPVPVYPRFAVERGYEGVVLLRVVVKSDGSVGCVEVLRSSGYEILDRSAARTVKTWRFEPAKALGAPVESKVEIPVQFKLETLGRNSGDK